MLLKKLYDILVKIYFDIIRDPLVAVCGRLKKVPKKLVLDMDWYHWCLTEQEERLNLHSHPLISRYADFIRIERSQVFKKKDPPLEISQADYKGFTYGGFNLWGICKATILSNLGALKIEPENPGHLKEVQRVYGEAVVGIENIRKLFKRLRPDTVFVCQGGVFDSRCIIEVARRAGINVVGVENSMIGGFIIFDNLSGLIINRYSLARLGSEILETWQVTDSDRKKVFEMWRRKLSEKADEHKTGGVDGAEEIRKALDIPEGKSLLLLLTQVRTDASIALDSTLYEDPVDMIVEVAKSIRDSEDTLLLIRLHPKEFMGKAPNGIPYNRMTYNLLRERGIDRMPNVKIVEDPRYNTYTLMEIANAGVTINSQAGFEMCLLGKPVMVCGNAFYGNKGFTVDLGHPAALKPTLDFLVHKAEMSPGQHERALNFLHFLYTRHLFDHKLSINQERLAEIFGIRPMPGVGRKDRR